jgi:hypothetical protein
VNRAAPLTIRAVHPWQPVFLLRSPTRRVPHRSCDSITCPGKKALAARVTGRTVGGDETLPRRTRRSPVQPQLPDHEQGRDASGEIPGTPASARTSTLAHPVGPGLRPSVLWVPALAPIRVPGQGLRSIMMPWAVNRTPGPQALSGCARLATRHPSRTSSPSARKNARAMPEIGGSSCQ